MEKQPPVRQEAQFRKVLIQILHRHGAISPEGHVQIPLAALDDYIRLAWLDTTTIDQALVPHLLFSGISPPPPLPPFVSESPPHHRPPLRIDWQTPPSSPLPNNNNKFPDRIHILQGKVWTVRLLNINPKGPAITLRVLSRNSILGSDYDDVSSYFLRNTTQRPNAVNKYVEWSLNPSCSTSKLPMHIQPNLTKNDGKLAHHVLEFSFPDSSLPFPGATRVFVLPMKFRVIARGTQYIKSTTITKPLYNGGPLEVDAQTICWTVLQPPPTGSPSRKRAYEPQNPKPGDTKSAPSSPKRARPEELVIADTDEDEEEMVSGGGGGGGVPTNVKKL
jgi:hypothetical protein